MSEVRVFELTVEGTPVPQPRPRIGRGRAYRDDRHPVHAWRDAIAVAWRQQHPGLAPLKGPVAAQLAFYLPRPKHKQTRRNPQLPEYHALATADCDNLAKAALDALNGLAFGDDGQVAHLSIEKRLASADRPPGLLANFLPLPTA